MTALTVLGYLAGAFGVLIAAVFLLLMVYTFYAFTMIEGGANREKLKHGSVLSPNTHPSYSKVKQEAYDDLDEARANFEEQELVARAAVAKL